MEQLHSIQFVTNLREIGNCLFNNILCQYNPKLPTVYFSLGEAIAAIGLIFAVIQLSKPSWNITLAIRGNFYKNLVWFLLGFGAVCVLISALLPQTEFNYRPISYPIFWEIIGFIFFLSAPISLWFLSTIHKGLYGRKNAVRFYHVVLQNISKHNPEYLEACVDILNTNLEEIIRSASKINVSMSKKEIIKENEYAMYSSNLLNLFFSENKVANYIATQRVDVLINLVNLICKYKIKSQILEMGFDKIINCLFNNKSSYLYQQLSYDGISLYSPVYKYIFRNSYIIGEFNIFNQWELFEYSKSLIFDERYIKVFLKAIENSIEISKFNNCIIDHKIAFAITRIPDYIGRLAYKLRSEKITNKSMMGNILISIEMFFNHTFPEMYKRFYNDASDYEKEAKIVSKYKQSLSATFAETAIEFLGQITFLDQREIENTYVHCLDGVLPIHDNPDTSILNLRKAVLHIIWKEINANVHNGFYPAIIRIYILIMHWNSSEMPEWRKQERKKLIDFLNKDLKPRLIKNELMASGENTKEEILLPKELLFDNKSHKYYWINRVGKKEEFK